MKLPQQAHVTVSKVITISKVRLAVISFGSRESPSAEQSNTLVSSAFIASTHGYIILCEIRLIEIKQNFGWK